MTFTDYAINIALLLLVVVQIRGTKLDRRSLLLPLGAVAFAASYYLKAVPTLGHDLTLDIVLGVTGALLGTACALTTRVWRDADGVPYAKAGFAAAALWIVGIGGRLAFEEYTTHGGAGRSPASASPTRSAARTPGSPPS